MATRCMIVKSTTNLYNNITGVTFWRRNIHFIHQGGKKGLQGFALMDSALQYFFSPWWLKCILQRLNCNVILQVHHKSSLSSTNIPVNYIFPFNIVHTIIIVIYEEKNCHMSLVYIFIWLLPWIKKITFHTQTHTLKHTHVTSANTHTQIQTYKQTNTHTYTQQTTSHTH